jgi:hypothetical protein
MRLTIVLLPLFLLTTTAYPFFDMGISFLMRHKSACITSLCLLIPMKIWYNNKKTQEECFSDRQFLLFLKDSLKTLENDYNNVDQNDLLIKLDNCMSKYYAQMGYKGPEDIYAPYMEQTSATAEEITAAIISRSAACSRIAATLTGTSNEVLHPDELSMLFDFITSDIDAAPATRARVLASLLHRSYKSPQFETPDCPYTPKPFGPSDSRPGCRCGHRTVPEHTTFQEQVSWIKQNVFADICKAIIQKGITAIKYQKYAALSMFLVALGTSVYSLANRMIYSNALVR